MVLVVSNGKILKLTVEEIRDILAEQVMEN